jgi:uncharacterized protein YebE (UPF0316 family)
MIRNMLYSIARIVTKSKIGTILGMKIEKPIALETLKQDTVTSENHTLKDMISLDDLARSTDFELR